MPHADSLIITLVGGFVLAFVFGMLANRLKLSPLVGYLVAGVIVGPYTGGFVADTDLANELAEIGIVLLMFGVGLHFSVKEFGRFINPLNFLNELIQAKQLIAQHYEH